MDIPKHSEDNIGRARSGLPQYTDNFELSAFNVLYCVDPPKAAIPKFEKTRAMVYLAKIRPPTEKNHHPTNQ